MPTLLRSGRGRGVLAAKLAVAAALASGALVGLTAGPANAATCSVQWSTTADWGYGFQAQLGLTPGNAVTSWRVDFDLAVGQTVAFAAYVGSFTQTGTHVSLTSASFNGNLPAGSSVNVLVGVHTNLTGTNAPPSGFVVNGQTCGFTPPPRIIASTFRITVPEGGSVAVQFSLSQPPSVPIVVQVGGGSGNNVITPSPTSLTFTPANWSVPQAITFTSAEDADTTAQPGTFPVSQRLWMPQFFQQAVILATQLDND